MSNNQSEFQKIFLLSSFNTLYKKKTKEINPINLLALLLLFISLLFVITLSVILNIQNKSISKLDSHYNSLSLSSQNITAKISSLKEENYQYIILMNLIRNELYSNSKRYEDHKTKLNELKRTNVLLSKSKMKSKIIAKEERIIISKMIDEANPPILKMVYQASSTHKGDSSQVFHDQCRGIGPFVALIKIENNIRIGGYSSVVFQEDNGYLKDDKAFLFNIDDKTKYIVNDPDRALSYNNILFLNFGSSDLFITDEFFTNRFSYTNFPKSYGNPEDNSQKNKLTKGLTLFNVLEFELLQVIQAN